MMFVFVQLVVYLHGRPVAVLFVLAFGPLPFGALFALAFALPRPLAVLPPPPLPLGSCRTSSRIPASTGHS